MLITYNINIKTLLSVPDVAHGGLMYGIVKTIWLSLKTSGEILAILDCSLYSLIVETKHWYFKWILTF